jgi:hypothetical protein
MSGYGEFVVLRSVRFRLKTRASIFVSLFTRRRRDYRRENMSPFCLIDVTEIKQHTKAARDVRGGHWLRRLAGSIARVLRARHD